MTESKGAVFAETERLVLRAFTLGDAVDLFRLHNDPEVMRYLNGGTPTPLNQIKNEILPEFIARADSCSGCGVWAAIDRSTGAFLGWFALRRREGDGKALELGYRLRRAAWGRGLATEGSRALIRTAFADHDSDSVFAQTMAVNARSRRVMEKAGMSLVRSFHEWFPDPLPGTEEGEVEYAITREDWLRGNG